MCGSYRLQVVVGSNIKMQVVIHMYDFYDLLWFSTRL